MPKEIKAIERLNVRINTSLKRKLKGYCKKNGVSQQEVATQLLTEHLKNFRVR